jgi:hypothetical protein
MKWHGILTTLEPVYTCLFREPMESPIPLLAHRTFSRRRRELKKDHVKSVANFSSSDDSNHSQHLCYFLADGDTFITRNTNTSPCSWEYLGVTNVTSGRAPYMLNARVLCRMQSLARGLSSNA